MISPRCALGEGKALSIYSRGKKSSNREKRGRRSINIKGRKAGRSSSLYQQFSRDLRCSTILEGGGRKWTDFFSVPYSLGKGGGKEGEQHPLSRRGEKKKGEQRSILTKLFFRYLYRSGGEKGEEGDNSSP